MTQTEAELEQKLIDRITGLGYEPVTLRNAEDLKANFKTQLEKHNHIKLSDTEFKSILNHLEKGNVFDRTKRLRDKMELSLLPRIPQHRTLVSKSISSHQPDYPAR